MIKPILNNNTQTNFKGTYLVSIPKKAFFAPKNIEHCFYNFTANMNKQVYEDTSTLDAFLMLFLKKSRKYISKLMGEGYYDLKSKTPYSDEWVKLHTGVELEKPLHKDYHSFYVFTKDEKNQIVKHFNSRNNAKKEKKLNAMQMEAQAQGRGYDELTMDAFRHKIYEDEINKIINNKIDTQIVFGSQSEQEYKLFCDFLKNNDLI